ncbi:uncharacterized protein B0P05DRAFT_528803 [Gilbertella persicaria]|uniref:uncharacterized protein n=1 Tax=Gilbertella persicaria TaxID=101096 RepID=UPI00221EFF51|nr:uncharacterized protein B0P05DRAFT_528803 [Gilbertella persicaria]KAI8091100.1 hypothetical protein B0P05DRAFT_528803 [Gilbertella persicaria]
MRGLTFIAVVAAALVGLSSAADLSARSSESKFHKDEYHPQSRPKACPPGLKYDIGRKTCIKINVEQLKKRCTGVPDEECYEYSFDSQGFEQVNLKKRVLDKKRAKKPGLFDDLLGHLLNSPNGAKDGKGSHRVKPAGPVTPNEISPAQTGPSTKGTASGQGPTPRLKKRRIPIRKSPTRPMRQVGAPASPPASAGLNPAGLNLVSTIRPLLFPSRPSSRFDGQKSRAKSKEKSTSYKYRPGSQTGL